jgi:hypothetical protein
MKTKRQVVKEIVFMIKKFIKSKREKYKTSGYSIAPFTNYQYGSTLITQLQVSHLKQVIRKSTLRSTTKTHVLI